MDTKVCSNCGKSKLLQMDDGRYCCAWCGHFAAIPDEDIKGRSQGFLLRKATVDETLELERAQQVSLSDIEEQDMEVYLLIPPEGEKFLSTENLAMRGRLICPICALQMPVHIKEINFRGFFKSDSSFLTSCSNCHATTEFRGITTGKDSEGTSKFWLIVWPTTGPPGVRLRRQTSQPRIKMEIIERSVVE